MVRGGEIFLLHLMKYRRLEGSLKVGARSWIVVYRPLLTEWGRRFVLWDNVAF
ncbi:hypothetical protein [Bartonella tribocorum]|uniref:hypothetical protein n=1 Tax=Bartonella tribocorum TaxID=85701 RepID=UPI0015D55EEB|nr:hypothetical protein [Bartonella tribocorum]